MPVQTAVPPQSALAHRIRPWVGLALLGIAAACLIVGSRRDAGLLHGASWAIRPGRLAAGTALEIGLLGWTLFLWSRILSRFEGPQPDARALMRVWCASTLAKYVPGSIWSLATTAEMATGAGASPVALPSSFLLQGALNVAGAIVLASLVHVGATDAVHLPAWLAAAVSVGVLALVHPAVVNRLVRFGARATRRPAPAWRGSWTDGALLLGLYVATWAAYGVSFALFLSGVTSLERVPWTELAGINALAFAAGFVAFFAPGGVGVREAALVGLLAPFVPGRGTRIGIAAASRLWLVLTEALAGALMLVAARRKPRGVAWRSAQVASVARELPAMPHERPLPDRGVPSPRAQMLRGVIAEPLTDTALALVDITAACRAATRSIRIAQLAFDADCVATIATADGPPQPLLDAILQSARRTGVDVRIVLQGGLLLDTSPALRQAIVERGGGANVRVRTVRAFPAVMHSKLLVVDDQVAFLMGASFVNGYWDAARHRAAGDPAATAGAGARPLHDVAMRLRGPAAPALGRWFDRLWRDARPAGDEAPDDAMPHETVPDETVPDETSPPITGSTTFGPGTARLLRTSPTGNAGHPDGHMEILDAYLDAIGRATECIYLESQYFSARPIAQAVGAALAAHRELELILVLNQNPDITGYRGWQDARLAEQRLLAHPRAGAFALWSTAPSRRAPGRAEVTQVFVHGKVAVIDDAWATLGTANLDGASLHSYGDDFARWPGRRVFGGVRNYDLNVELLDGIDGEPRTGVAGALRRQLWARHLGVAEYALRDRPSEGWLPTWRAAASANVACLAAGGRAALRGRVLPYVTRTAHPREQLRALGIDDRAAGLDLRFDPSRLDALCNLGWMKKIVPERMRRWS